MIIGSFTYNEEADAYVGDIVTINFGIKRVTFVPNDKKSDKEPDYRITAAAESGEVELGAGWKRTSEKGQAFVSVSLDGPLLAAPFNAALFPGEDGGTASLVWNRPKAKAKSEACAKKAA